MTDKFYDMTHSRYASVKSDFEPLKNVANDNSDDPDIQCYHNVMNDLKQQTTSHLEVIR